MLKAEPKRRGIGHQQLSEQLGEARTTKSEANIRNNVSRNMISAVILVQCSTAIDCRVTHLRPE